MDATDTQAINAEIQKLKESNAKLRKLGHAFPAVQKNSDRIQACIKMLELNVTDLYTLVEDDQK